MKPHADGHVVCTFARAAAEMTDGGVYVCNVSTHDARRSVLGSWVGVRALSTFSYS